MIAAALERELIVDNFAGGGGASTGIEMALGISPDYAINHDAIALGMHAVNHPATQHLCTSVWKVDPDEIEGDIGLGWFSPDCKHFSKAKGARPVDKGIRDLAWVVVRWARRRAGGPRVIILENVEEWITWGPLAEDNRPCPLRKGSTFKRFVRALRAEGYTEIGWRELWARDYGAPTRRKRLFFIARRDGEPIVWPKPTHGDPRSDDVKAGRLKPWLTSANDVIDWSLPCHSIFLSPDEARAAGVRRPLAAPSLTRIVKGVRRYVLDAAMPFMVPITHVGDSRVYGLDEPLRTITTAHRGEQALIAPSIAFLAQNNYLEPGHDAREPMSTIVSKGSTQSVVSAFLTKYYGADQDPRIGEPLHTATTKHRFGLAEVLIGLPPFSPEHAARARQVADLLRAHGAWDDREFVTLEIEGVTCVIVDIGMRMLAPRELFRAQGFRDSYIIDRLPDGAPITKTQQVAKCGNSVCPPIAAALVGANFAPRRVSPKPVPDHGAFSLEAAA